MKPSAVAFAWASAALAFAASDASAGSSADDEAYCRMFSEAQQEMSASRGERINRLTAFAGIDVRCSEKEVDFQQTVLAPSSKLRTGWQARLQERWSAAYCQPGSKSLEAVRNGWTIATTVTTSDGTQVRISADCRLAVAERDDSGDAWGRGT